MNVTERFLRYVSYDTKSDPESGKHPSSEKQLKLAAALRDELAFLGLEKVKLSELGYVSAELPASEGCEDIPRIGLIAHMDTSPDMPGNDIKARTVEYSGGDILLNEEKNIVMTVADFPYLEDYIGKHLIVTDGTTLLGADDKAGVAEIFSALEYLAAHPEIKHGAVPVCITPDEEIGEGADGFDVEGFAADFAYTVDGGALGELEYENFNAASAKLTFNGINIHPGSAKDKMKNAVLIAAEYIGMLPADEIPAKTEGYEGFYHLNNFGGDVEKSYLFYIIRDHDREKLEEKKRIVQAAADALNEKYGAGTVEAEITDSYYNMREKIEPHMYIIDRAAKAFKTCGVEPITTPIRGGTDGARLSFMGLPCPNLSTGGHNFHGRFEFIPTESMEKMVEVLVELLKAQ